MNGEKDRAVKSSDQIALAIIKSKKAQQQQHLVSQKKTSVNHLQDNFETRVNI